MNNEPIKLFNKIAIIDASYFLHRSLHQPDLWDLRNPNTHERTGGIFGFLRIFNSEIRNLDYYPVCIWDAGLAERRLAVYPNYKHNFDKLVETVANKVALENLPFEEVVKDYEDKLANVQTFSDSIEELRARVAEQLKHKATADEDISTEDDEYLAQYRRQRAILISILDSFGIPSIRISGWEGDDLMTILSRISTNSIILTDDKDLQQLVSPSIKNYRPMTRQWVEYETLGDCTPRDLAIVKAIVGDGSDNIPSVTAGEERKYSLGAKRAWAVSKIIRENDEDPDKYLPILESMNKNYYAGFIKNHDKYLRNMELVDLSLVENDESIIQQMEASILERLGKGNLFEVLGKLGDAGINNLDVNGLLSKIIMVSPLVRIK